MAKGRVTKPTHPGINHRMGPLGAGVLSTTSTLLFPKCMNPLIWMHLIPEDPDEISGLLVKSFVWMHEIQENKIPYL